MESTATTFRPIKPKGGEAVFPAHHASALTSFGLENPRRPPRRAKAKIVSREEWERQKLNIDRLYMSEDLTLKELMARMLKEHDFQATEKQYKSQITHWGLTKKAKRDEMFAIVRKGRARQAAQPSKRSIFKINGRPVTEEKIARFLKERNIGDSQIVPYVKTPPGVLCTTPSAIGSPSLLHKASGESPNANPDPIIHLRQSAYGDVIDVQKDFRALSRGSAIPQTISLPHVYGILEGLLLNASFYIACSFDTRTWITIYKPSGEELWSVKCTRESSSDTIKFYDYCQLAVRCHSENSWIRCRRVLSDAFQLLKNILLMEPPVALQFILSSLLLLAKHSLQDIATTMRRYIKQVAAKMFSRMHPWYEICRLLGEIEPEDLQSTLTPLFLKVVEGFESHLGSFHRQSIRYRTSYLDIMWEETGLSGKESQLRKLLANCEAFCGRSNVRYRQIIRPLSLNLYEQGRYTEAAAIACDILKGKLGTDYNSAINMVFDLKLLASCQYALSEFPTAEKNIRMAIGTAIEVYGMRHPWTMESMSTLECWLRKWGRINEADSLQAEFDSLLGSDEFDQLIAESLEKPATRNGVEDLAAEASEGNTSCEDNDSIGGSGRSGEDELVEEEHEDDRYGIQDEKELDKYVATMDQSGIMLSGMQAGLDVGCLDGVDFEMTSGMDFHMPSEMDSEATAGIDFEVASGMDFGFDAVMDFEAPDLAEEKL